MKELKATVFGVGINDVDYKVCELEVVIVDGKRKYKIVWRCPYYCTWYSMLRRCYSAAYHKKNPTYLGCSVIEEWKYLSAFKAWMEKQDWEGRQLDKDLLFVGNKVYSESTCVFVSSMVNKFTTERGAKRGEHKIGVSWHKRRDKFVAQVNNPLTAKKEHLGYFTCEQEAHQAWLTRKCALAHQLADIQDDSRVAKALISRYTNFNIK